MEIREVDKSMEESVSRRMITDKLEEAYNDTFVWGDDDMYSRGIKEGIYIAMTVINALPSAQSELLTAIQDILDYLDRVLHPLVSPDNWHVYSNLYDMVEQLNFCQNCGADRRRQE